MTIVLLLLLGALLGLAVLLAGLVRPLTPRARVLRLTWFAAVYVWVDLVVVAACCGLWLRHPRRSRRGEVWAAEHWGLLRWALASALAAGQRAFGFRLIVDEPAGAYGLDGDEPLLVMARHGGPGDSFAIAHLLMTRYQRRPRIVLKATLQYDPGLDLLLNRLASCFLPSRTGAGDDLPARLADSAATLTGRDALLIFPEGGNWTPRRRRRALRRLRREGELEAADRMARLPRLLPPRPAGARACLAARPDVGVVVVAHGGLDGLTSPSLTWAALPLSAPMRLHWWFVAPDAIPRGEAEQERWLVDQWERVEVWLEANVPGPESQAAAAN